MKIYVNDERGYLVMKQIGIRKPIASIPKKKELMMMTTRIYKIELVSDQKVS